MLNDVMKSLLLIIINNNNYSYQETGCQSFVIIYVYNLEGVLLFLRVLHLDVAPFSRGGSVCILGGARTLRRDSLPLRMPFFALLLALTEE